MKIVGIVGSMRARSYNRALMNAFIASAPQNVVVEVADITALPFFSEDEEDPYPETAQKLKEHLRTADAFIIATPEYNRGTPGILKNAIDWMSRPKNPSPFFRKPVLVVGASDGNIGTAVAQASLKNTLLHLDAYVLGKPEFFLGRAQDKVDEQGVINDPKTLEFVKAALDTLIERTLI